MIKKRVALFFLLFFIVIRLIWLDADPFWLKHYSDIHDEAWWADNARLMFLYGAWQMDEFAGAWAVSPVGTWLHYVSFYFGGINFLSLRFWSALSGLLSIALIYWLSTKNRLENPIFIAAAFASFQTWLLWNRIGHWESTLGFLLLLIYSLLFYRVNFFKLILATCIATMATFIKPTFIYLAIPIFVLYLVSNPNSIKHKAKQLVVIMLPAFLIALGFKLFYFDVHQLQFQPYYQHFQTIYYTWFDLVNPIYFLSKLSGIFNNEFFVQPDVALLFLALLVFKTDKQPMLKQLRLLILLVFIGLLFSDFNSRRFIPLFPLLAFYTLVCFQKAKISLSQLDWFRQSVLFIFSVATVGLFTHNAVLLFIFCAFILMLTILMNRFHKTVIQTWIILVAIFILVASGNYCAQQWDHFEKPNVEINFQTVMQAWFWISILLLGFLLIFLKFRIAGLLFFFTLFTLVSLSKLNFSIVKTNRELAPRLQGAVIGDLFSFEVAFLSRSYMLHYITDSVDNQIRIKQKMRLPNSVVISNFGEFQTEKGIHKSLKNLNIQTPSILETWPVYDLNSRLAVYYFSLKAGNEEKTEDKPK